MLARDPISDVGLAFTYFFPTRWPGLWIGC